MIKNLLLTLLLISPASFGDWGDVYYCQMTSHAAVTLEGKRTDYLQEKFQFKLDETKKAMVFGSSGYFENTEEKLTPYLHWPNQEYWYSSMKHSMAVFDKGKFLHSVVLSSHITSVTADCDKF
jgi:hypothetical protein